MIFTGRFKVSRLQGCKPALMLALGSETLHL